MSDIKLIPGSCLDSQSSSAQVAVTASAAVIICSVILPAGFIIIKTMTWFPFMRRTFLDQTPIDVQLAEKIRNHNDSIKKTLSKTAAPAMKRHKSLIAMDRPAFDSSAELLTPPESDAESSPESKPKVLVPLKRQRSLPQPSRPDISSEKTTAIHKIELMHLLLTALHQTSRITVASFMSETKMIAPHLVEYLLQLDSPVADTMKTDHRKGFMMETMVNKMTSFISEFNSIIIVKDKSIVSLVTKEQLADGLQTTKAIMSEKLVQYIRSRIQEQLSQSILLRDIHSELNKCVPYVVSQKFLTISMFREFVSENGFLVDENEVVRIGSGNKSGTKAQPRQALRESGAQPSHQDGQGLKSKTVAFSKQTKQTPVTDGKRDDPLTSAVTSHGPQCICANLENIVKRLPTARLKKLLSERPECLVHHYIMKNKIGMTECN